MKRSLLLFVTLAMIASVSFGQSKFYEDFEGWTEVDTNLIKQAGSDEGLYAGDEPFAFSVAGGELSITAATGHDEWDKPVVKFASPINMITGGLADTIFVRAKVLAGHTGDANITVVPIDGSGNSVSNNFDVAGAGNNLPLTTDYQVFKYVVKAWWSEYGTGLGVDSTDITQLNIAINPGCFSFPWVNLVGETVDESLTGTVVIDYIAIGSVPTGINDVETVNGTLLQSSPNPAKGFTKVQYTVNEKADVSIKLYDILGQEVAVLENGTKTTGAYLLNVNTASYKNGVYYYTLNINGANVATQKLIINK